MTGTQVALCTNLHLQTNHPHVLLKKKETLADRLDPQECVTYSGLFRSLFKFIEKIEMLAYGEDTARGHHLNVDMSRCFHYERP